MVKFVVIIIIILCFSYALFAILLNKTHTFLPVKLSLEINQQITKKTANQRENVLAC